MIVNLVGLLNKCDKLSESQIYCNQRESGMSINLENNLPPTTWRGSVSKHWCDYNGHLNLAYFVVLFDLATDQFYDSLGIGEEYTEVSGFSCFTAESHVCYLLELFAKDRVFCTTQLIAIDSKRIHYIHRMFKEKNKQLVATNELLALHVNLNQRAVAEFKTSASKKINAIFERHRGLSKPDQLGRRISIEKSTKKGGGTQKTKTARKNT